MKILFITPYITSTKDAKFMHNQTGLGYMVHDIAEWVGKKENVSLFTVSIICKEQVIDGFRVIGRSWINFIFSFRLHNLLASLSFIKKYPQSFKDNIRCIFKFLSIGEVEKIIRNFDILHIHGCSPITEATIRACQRYNIPFLVTLHGLISFEEGVIAHRSLKKYERDFLLTAYKKGWPVSFISTGNKETAEDFIINQIKV